MPGPPPPPPSLLMQATAVAAAASVSGGGGMVPPPLYLTPPVHHIIPHPSSVFSQNSEALLHYTFPSEADTLAYVDALKHSDLSDWRSLQEVADRAGGGSCSGAVTTSVLTALYLLGLFNLCAASPSSCCVPPASGRRRRRRTVDDTLPPLLNNLQHNLSSLSLEQFRDLPHVTTPDGGRIPLHISVVDQVRKLWDSNPRLLSSVSCSTATESVRSSFISLSGVASGIILAYSVAQLTQCYPDHTPDIHIPPKIWFFPIPNTVSPPRFPVPIIPTEIPVQGSDDNDDGCERNEVPMGFDKCAPLLSSEFCPYKHWVLLNKETGMGECVPRLCSDNFIYVESDEMCHDINEPGICPGNRRLYIDASGYAICDCPEGMFPGPRDTCYYLHEPAYCYRDSVLQFNKASKTLACKPDPCRNANEELGPNELPFAPHKDGSCYQFNKEGPCKKEKLFGFDTDRVETACVSLLEAGLIQPRRNFMYQQMSYPAMQDQQYSNYQVSYIIVNGSTWHLEVKGIGRNRRDLSSLSSSPHVLHAEEMVVPFFDTREVPRHLYPMMRPRVPRWVTNKRNKRGSNHGKARNNESRSHTEHTEHVNNNSNGSGSAPLLEDDETYHELDLESSPIFHFSFSSPAGSRTDFPQHNNHHRNEAKTQRKRKGNGRTEDLDDNGSGSIDDSFVKIQRNVLNRQKSSLSRVHNTEGDDVIKVNQPGMPPPVVVHQTHTEQEGNVGQKKKEHRRDRNSRRQREKKKRRNRGRGRRRGRKKRPNKSRNATRPDNAHKRKNPKIPLPVPTLQPQTDANITLIMTDFSEDGTSSSDINERTVNSSRVSHSSVSASSTKSESGGKVRTKPHRISATDKNNENNKGEGFEEKQTSSSETSLPKYLRHRGRRQLGEGGGIIQAPLLTACKPGAKRDYNYKCRPKFIPQERDRRGAAGVGTSNKAAPRQPSISCPEGTRLDPRGKCQQVS